MEAIETEQVKEDIMKVITTDHATVSCKLKIRILSEPEQKERKKTKKKQKHPLNRIQNKKVWEAYQKKCNQNEIIEKAIAELKKSQNGESKVEDAWKTVK